MTKLTELVQLRQMCESGEARHIREAAGVSQGELAQEAETTVQSVHRWETGQRTPRGDAAMRYLRVLRSLRKMVEAAQ